ncbi:hypothetical protein BDV24DRAFT_110100 [Aspergillus arachidicola]|uniref:FAD dependent oxidoreductase domain-containing protein n=1 Tax=Aspergillus arachidicola TaxID=656916 RepID=A0A5N6XU43_9EURO|nr:hypothetical protein BDV24DRAFT_110100 [Aspergillus arachidicola]
MAAQSSVVLSDNAKSTLVSQIHQDPGVPKPNPTVPTWQLPPHPLSDTQSAELGQVTDFAIIGSGVTGCSVAKTLLENTESSGESVTVLEARTLTSGATSRNAGFLLSAGPKNFLGMVERFGKDEAVAISKFCKMTLDKMAELVVEAGPEVESSCERRMVRCIIAFKDEKALAAHVASIRLYEESFPEHKGLYSVIGRKEAQETYNLRDTAGALTTSAYVFWPYRFIPHLFEFLLRRYSARFHVETRTPVTSVVYSPDTNEQYPYVLATSRGILRARQVFHCTNAFTGHLLPHLRGKIYPVRLTMSSQKRGSQFPNHGAQFCWMYYGSRSYEAESGVYESGMHFMQQNARTGDLFFGGGTQQIDQVVTSDDSEVSATAKRSVSTLLPEIYSKGWDGAPQVDKLWTGIIGCTADQVPLVGRVPATLSRGRSRGGEWVAAGFNGYGMAMCWSSGEAIAKMALGEAVPEWLPRSLLVDEKRLRDEVRMGPGAAIKSLL